MKKNTSPYRVVILVTLLFVFTFPVVSQNSDGGLWTSIELKKKLGHGMALSLEEDYRLRDYGQMTDKSQTSLDFSWKPFKFLKAGVGYTYIASYQDPNKRDSTYHWEPRHRVYVYLTGNYDLGRFKIALREKFQRTYRVGIAQDSNRSNPTYVLRSKLNVSYDIKGWPLSPYVSGEVFYALNEPDGKQNPPSTAMFTEGRLGAGLEYDITKKLNVSLGYLFCMTTEWDDDVRDAFGHKVGGYVKGREHVVAAALGYTF